MVRRPRVTLRQLSYFVTLAKAGGFTRAAERMNVSQPSLSQQIRGLEEAVGAALVERGSPPILTPFGREVLNRARRILHSVHDLEDFSEAQGYGLVGTIRLGVSPTLGPYILPGLVARLHREHPALRVHVREGLPDVLVTGLASGEHDIVLVQLPMPDRGFHVERLFREPLFLAMAADHPLRTKAMIEKEDLAGEQLLALQPGYRLAEQAAAIAEEAGAVLLRDYEGTSLNAVRQMAGMGMGLALLPQLYVRQEIRGGDDVIVRPFANGRYYREIGLLWRQGASRTPSFQTIAGYLREIG